MRLEDFLAQNTQTKTFKKGEAIFTEGKQATAAYYIQSGNVEIYKGPEGKPTSVAKLGPDEIFGEMSLLRFDAYTLSARALSDCTLHVITPDLLREQLRTTHPLIRTILDMLVARVHEANETLIDLDRTGHI